MNEVSCEVLETIPTPLPVQLVLPFTRSKFFTPFHEAHYALTRCWKTLFAYQFVIVAAPCHSPVPKGSEMVSVDALPTEKVLSGK
jgi:hypothetical protein